MQALPPPDELASLTLTELMEILTSARPMHDVITRIFERREKRAAPNNEPEVDPHKKVDTSQFLLRRMRRVAQALEGMRERLQQPVGSLDALRWRLRGPIGPIALAKRLDREDPAGAAFMIAEVATTLREVPWKRFGSLSAGDLRADVIETMVALSELACKRPPQTVWSNMSGHLSRSSCVTWPIELDGLGARLNLKNDRISEADAIRQYRTVEEILRRLANQPGIVLADEVGMGKTFVALGVAMVAALTDRQRRPVVIMVPSSLHEKWPREFEVFEERAIQRAGRQRFAQNRQRRRSNSSGSSTMKPKTAPTSFFSSMGRFMSRTLITGSASR